MQPVISRDEVKSIARTIEGHLSDKEIDFLYLAASYPSTRGEILEIGSFKGKSTVVLAKSAMNGGNTGISCIDPLTSPSSTDPDLCGNTSCLDDFTGNIRRAGVEDNVEFHHDFSYNIAPQWDKQLRLLWIDGDHTYGGAKSDFDNFVKHLSDGGIIAFHDVLNRFDGPLRVFMEDVLLSDHFGSAGCCGSIGWAQYFTDSEKTKQYVQSKLNLYKKLSMILPFSVYNVEVSGLKKYQYKYYRARVPHGRIENPLWKTVE